MEFTTYFKGGIKQHAAGLVGGVIWYLGLLAGMVGTSVPETLQPNPLVRLILGQAAPVVAALFGITIWQDSRAATCESRFLPA